MRARAFFTLLALAGCFAIPANAASAQQVNRAYCEYKVERFWGKQEILKEMDASNCAGGCASMFVASSSNVLLKDIAHCYEMIGDNKLARYYSEWAIEQAEAVREFSKELLGVNCECGVQ